MNYPMMRIQTNVPMIPIRNFPNLICWKSPAHFLFTSVLEYLCNSYILRPLQPACTDEPTDRVMKSSI